MDLVAPTTVNGTVTSQPPRRKTNAELRAREYLTDAEVTKSIEAAGDNRYGHRDATMVLLAYRHGFRVSELVGLRWEAIDFNAGRLHVNRAKNGSPSVHPLSGRELEPCAVYAESRNRNPPTCSPARGPRRSRLLASASGGPALRAGSTSGPCPMSADACGFALEAGHRYPSRCKRTLGHKNIHHPVGYTELAPRRGFGTSGRTDAAEVGPLLGGLYKGRFSRVLGPR